VSYSSRFTEEYLRSIYPYRAPLSPLVYNETLGHRFAQQTLRQAAKAAGIYIGGVRNYWDSRNTSDTKYTQVLNAQYDLNTAENGCKWGAIAQNRNSFDYSQCDYLSQAAFAAQAVFRGHNLCWGSSNPNWLQNGNFNGQQLDQILTNYITNVAGRYKGKFICWDVVNEAVSDNPQPNQPLKNTVWYPKLPNFIDIAFQTARKADSTVKLFYNDYNAEGMNAKSNAVYDLVKSMKQRGIPIDGVGLQMHVSTDYYPNPNDVSANIARLGALGLEVHITEMDVSCKGNCDLQKQAQVYGNLLQACLKNSNCKNYETWGFTDRYTWLGSDARPLPFDVNYNPKPAFNEILAVLQQHAK